MIKKDDLFCKTVPTWASDLNLIAQVVVLQYRIARAGLNVSTTQKLNVAGRKHPVSFSWCYWDEMQARRCNSSSTKGSSGEAYGDKKGKKDRLKNEAQEMF